VDRNLKAMREERVALLDKREQTLQRVDSAGKSSATASKELRACEAITADIKALDQEIAKETAREESIKRRLLGSDIEVRNAFGGQSGQSVDLNDRERRAAFSTCARINSSLAPTEAGLALAQRAGYVPGSNSLHFDMPEQRAMSTTSATHGSLAIPEGFVPSLERALKAYGSVRSAARLIQTGSGNELHFPTTNDTGNRGRRLQENSQVQNTDVAISEVRLGAHTYSSDLVLTSVQLLTDQEVDFESHLGDILGERLGRIINAELTTGTGVDQPTGIVTASTLGKTAASTGAVTFAELVDLQHSVDPAYQQDAAFMLNWTTLASLKKIVDGDGRPLWQPSASAGMGTFPETLLGKRVIVNQDMPSIAAGQKPIIYGAFNRYLVREVRGIQLMRLNERYADHHQVAFLAFMRCDGQMLNAGTNPVKHLVMAGS
jgi:HK97 family phage major capsid protein